MFSGSFLYGQDPEHLRIPECKDALFAYQFDFDSLGLITFEELKGEQLVIHFWIDSCYFCEKELIELNKIENNYNHSLRSILILDDKSENIGQYIEEHKLSFTIIKDSNHKEIFNYETPISLLVDRDGIIQSITYSNTVLSEQLIRFADAKLIDLKK